MRQKVIEALMDKGYPYLEAWQYLIFMLPIDLISIGPYPSIYNTKESVNAYWSYKESMEKKELEKMLFEIDYMRPVWDRYSLWEYKI